MKSWLVAARPRTLLSSVAPVLVGGGLAIGDGAFRWDAFVVTLITAALINVAVNFANDASDAHRGVDGPQRIGPPRAVSSGMLKARQVWTGTAVVLVLACTGGAYLAWISSWWILGLGVAAIIAALAYTGGPWPYGYHGLGELFVFVFFGLAGVVGSRFVHDAMLTMEAWLLAIPVGFLVTAVLVVNNIRDLDTDRVAHKRTLAVVLGRRGTRILYATLVFGAFALIAAYAAFAVTPRWTLLALVAFSLAIPPVGIVVSQETGPMLIKALKMNVLLVLVVSVLLGMGAAV